MPVAAAAPDIRVTGTAPDVGFGQMAGTAEARGIADLIQLTGTCRSGSG
jgi:hypothetical protein